MQVPRYGRPLRKDLLRQSSALTRRKDALPSRPRRGISGLSRRTELAADCEPSVGDQHIEQACRRATPALVDVLRRYPLAPTGKSRVAQLMKTLDTSLRSL